MEVLIPGHGDEVDQLLRSTYANGRPTYVRASVDDQRRRARRRDRAGSRSLRRGADATVVAFGPMLDRTLAACEGLDVTVAYTTSLRAVRAPTGCVAIAGEAPVMVTVEPFYEGTAAPVVTAALVDRPMPRYASIGVPRAFIHAYGTPQDLDADVGLDVAGIRRSVLRTSMR